MSVSSQNEPVTWSLRQWYGYILLVVSGQIGVVMLLSSRGSNVAQVRVKESARMQFFMGYGADASETLSMGILEPALFAVSHKNGFSINTSRIPSPDAPALETRLEPPAWLNHSFGSNDNILQISAVKNLASTIPRLVPNFSAIPTLQTASQQSSRVWFEGGLKSRKLVSQPNLPLWPMADVPQASVVQMGVDIDGVPQSVRLVASSGVISADREAVRLAREFRFGSKPMGAGVGNEWDWGEAMFSWHLINPNRSPNP